MEPMTLASIDLNLLVVLQELIATKSVTQAGRNIGLSQSATSRALARLRDVFADELLVRTGRTYELSQKAKTIAPQLLRTLAAIEKIVAPQEFDPATAIYEYRVFGVELEIITFLPKLFSKLAKKAPQISLSIMSGTLNHFQLLQDGKVHFVLSALAIESGVAGIRRVALGNSPNTCIMAKGHPLAAKRLTLDRYLSCEHGVINLTDEGSSSTDYLLKKMGLQRRVRLKAPSFSSAAYFCEAEDIIFLMPDRMAQELCKRHKLIRKEPPKELRENTTFYLYWHERDNNEAPSRWFRELILDSKSGKP